VLDGVDHPAHGAEFEHADFDLGGGIGLIAWRRAGKGANQESQQT